jgi:hypothetical protein
MVQLDTDIVGAISKELSRLIPSGHDDYRIDSVLWDRRILVDHIAPNSTPKRHDLPYVSHVEGLSALLRFNNPNTPRRRSQYEIWNSASYFGLKLTNPTQLRGVSSNIVKIVMR